MVAFLDITFTNTNAFTYAAHSNIYFSALLTDANSLTATVTFTPPMTASGTMATSTPTTFTFENTDNLVTPITGSEGRILYTA